MTETLFFYSYAYDKKNHADRNNYPDGTPVTIMLTESPAKVQETKFQGISFETDNKRELVYGTLNLKINGNKILSRSKEFAAMQKKPLAQGTPVKGFYLDKSNPILDRETLKETGLYPALPVEA